MFDLLIRSKIRQKIIRLFILSPRREFYLSEVASAVGTTPGTVQRELRKLLKIDLVQFKKRGNLSIYNLNSRHYLLKEITGIMKKTFGIEDEIKGSFSRIDGIVFAFLFGSYVKGDLKTESDIDLYVIGGMSPDEIHRALSPIERSLGREINYHLATAEEFRAKKDEAFIKNILHSSLLILGNKHEFEAFTS